MSHTGHKYKTRFQEKSSFFLNYFLNFSHLFVEILDLPGPPPDTGTEKTEDPLPFTSDPVDEVYFYDLLIHFLCLFF